MELFDRRTAGIRFPAALIAIAAITICCHAGCSNNPFPVAKASGTIKTEDGSIIQSGIITFTPLAVNEQGHSGKPAYGEIENGKFEMSTYSDGDGAIIGKHEVTLTEAWRPDEEYVDENTSLPPRHGCVISPEFEQIEIVSGKNVFELVAVPKPERDEDEEELDD